MTDIKKMNSALQVSCKLRPRLVLKIQFTWWAFWLHLHMQFLSLYPLDRCWWIRLCCMHSSGISKSRSWTLVGRSSCTFWLPPEKNKAERSQANILRILGITNISAIVPSHTLTMWSFGKRLQSAKVISSPSKNLRLETVTSSILFSSISSGSGEFR